MNHKDFLLQLISPTAQQGGGGGDEPTGSVTLTANGTYNVKTKAQAIVAVPPYGEGSVNINSNGTHNVSGKAQAVVAVPGPSGSMNITENGTYDVTDKAQAVVNVSGGGGGGSANDWAYAFISGGYEGVLTDSEDPTVPRITKVISYSMEQELGLTGINLPACTEIGGNAFTGCSNLTDVNLPVCTNMGSYVFQQCVKLRNLSIPLCKTLPSYALPNLFALEVFDAKAIETIGSSAILGKSNSSPSNTAIKLLEFPALKTNGGGVQYFYGLTALRLGSAVTTLNGSAFRYNTALDTVIFGQNLASVPTMGTQYVFGGSAIRSGNGYVYVPDALEATWKTASLWSAIAAQIKPLSAITNWAAGTYNKPDVVKHGGHYYRCNNDGTTGEPGVDTTNWQDLGAIY